MGLLIKIDEIENGMVLAEPIVNNFGQTLLPAGSKLKDRHMRMLRTWNIFSVSIQDQGSEDDFELSQDLLLMAEEMINSKLDWKPGNAIEINLFEAAVNNIAYQLFIDKKS